MKILWEPAGLDSDTYLLLFLDNDKKRLYMTLTSLRVCWNPTLEGNPKTQTRPALEREPNAGAVCQLGRERGQIWVMGGNPIPSQLSPIDPQKASWEQGELV